MVEDDAVALLDDVFPLAIDKLSHVALILAGVLPRNGVHRLAHRVLGEALGNRGMAARACLGADIAGGSRGWLLERRYRRSVGHGGFSGRLRRLSRAGARGAGDGALSLSLSQARPGISRPLPFPAGGEPAPHEEAGDDGEPRRGDKKGGIAGPGHGGDEAPMRRGDHTCLQDSGAGVPVAMPATGPPCIGHRSDVAVRQGRGDARFPGPLIRCLPARLCHHQPRRDHHNDGRRHDTTVQPPPAHRPAHRPAQQSQT